MIKVCLKFNTSFINLISFVLSVFIVFTFNFGIKTIDDKVLNYSEKTNIQAIKLWILARKSMKKNKKTR